MKCFKTLQKISLLLITLSFIFSFSFAKANDMSKCEYEEALYGVANLTVAKGVYSLSLDTEMDAYTFVGSVEEDFFASADSALKAVTPNESGFKHLIVYTGLDGPVCAASYTVETLYIQPDVSVSGSKDYYGVGVCIPETSHCWTLKISKGSQMAEVIETNNGKLPTEGKICNVHYFPNKEIFYIEEVYNYYGDEDY